MPFSNVMEPSNTLKYYYISLHVIINDLLYRKANTIRHIYIYELHKLGLRFEGNCSSRISYLERRHEEYTTIAKGALLTARWFED